MLRARQAMLRSRRTHLPGRQREIVILAATGMASKDIARLDLSVLAVNKCSSSLGTTQCELSAAERCGRSRWEGLGHSELGDLRFTADADRSPAPHTESAVRTGVSLGPIALRDQRVLIVVAKVVSDRRDAVPGDLAMILV